MNFTESLTNGPHHFFQAFYGAWSGTTRTWFEPDVLADESPAKGKFSPILEGRFLLYEYEGSMQGKPFSGMMIIGCHLQENTLQSAWVDSFHMGTGIMFSEGALVSIQDKKIVVTGSYGDGQGGPRWGWRTEIQRKGDTLLITAYNITPAGEAAKATETVYQKL